MRSGLAERLLHVADPDAIIEFAREVSASVPLAAHRSLVVNNAHRMSADMTQLAEAMIAEEDEAELYGSLAALWLELRLEWQRHNQVANYTVVRAGECPHVILARASVASFLLGRLESLLATEHLDRLGDSAVTLLDQLRIDVERPAPSLSDS